MHWNNTVFTKPERWKCGPSLKQHWVNAPRCTCVTEQFKLTGQVTRSERVFTNTMRHRPNRFFFFFFFKIWYLAENEREKIAFRYSLYWGRCETPYFHCLAAFDVWFWRQKSSNGKRKKCQDSRNSHTPTVYNAFSQISVHFCHYFDPFFADISFNS